jgi:uncharacterized cupredoxin-like copper-binding protein
MEHVHMKFTTIRSSLFGAVAVAILASSAPSWADDTVNVSLSGDGGDKMAMTLDKTSVKTGKITFEVKNDASMTEHEMVVIKLKHKADKLPMIAGADRVDEDKLKSMGEVSELKPGTGGKLALKMPAGNYVLICNIKGHYMAGMWSTFTVTK